MTKDQVIQEVDTTLTNLVILHHTPLPYLQITFKSLNLMFLYQDIPLSYSTFKEVKRKVSFKYLLYINMLVFKGNITLHYRTQWTCTLNKANFHAWCALL